MSGLFGTFNIAKRGMEAQQTAINVTAHNISNAKTDGYSRQRATMETTRPAGMPSMNNAMGPGQLGTGVQISSITRIRDTFLDYQVRVENGTKGWYEGRESFLREIEGIMNEPSDTGVSTLLGKTFDSWSELSKHAESSNARTVVAQQSKALTDELNNTYNQLIKLKGGSQDVVGQTVVDINSMLNQLNDLNQQVISVKVGGNEPNDLMDKRDLLVDKLSLKFGINIDKKSLAGEDLKPLDNVGGADATKDLYLVKSNPSDQVSRFSYVKSIVPKGIVPPTEPPAVQKPGEAGIYEVSYYKNGDTSTEKNKVIMTMTLSSSDYKSLDQGRVLWADKEGYAIDVSGNRIEGKDSNNVKVPLGKTGKTTVATETTPTDTKINIKLFQPKSGELKGYMSVQEEIDKYVGELNGLAKSIAFSINAVHSGESDATKDALKFFINKDSGKEEEITAGNISVSKDILDDVMKIRVGKGDTPGATDGDRALAISSLKDVRLEIQNIDSKTTRDMFLKDKFTLDTTLGVETVNSNLNGMTIGSYFKDTVNRVAIENQGAKTIVKNQGTLIASLEKSRTSISGVSLDEEMVNMIQYQHAYQANAKIISTVDQLLDVVINGLKR
ncbi:flagellar hook-associated protein FlgK [Clostridium tagluense]|uniref:Flagellar hook-associated protein 1 n=1 Tax=Clostridium tagluense TaxID=360422 RepID=A0A401UHS5_9CLOT|nr:flagellar hook-associated protein FlgK [Clostridium tagluense]GCD09029.1 flagellar hook-associated protein FlgK [Clostridium tagluense]